MTKFQKILSINWLYSIYFNFHYLPVKQAMKLTILLYKPKLIKCKGEIVIDSETIKTGMIQFGEYRVSLYPNKGLVWENHGGKVIFKGECSIGNSSFVSIGDKAVCTFGNNFKASAGFKLTSHYRVNFDENVLMAWDAIVMDSSFHKLKDMNGQFISKGYSPVHIGKNNWITTRCMILSGTKTPDFCVIGAGSILKNDYTHFPTHVFIAGNPPEVKSKDIWIDLADNDIAEYM